MQRASYEDYAENRQCASWRPPHCVDRPCWRVQGSEAVDSPSFVDFKCRCGQFQRYNVVRVYQLVTFQSPAIMLGRVSKVVFTLAASLALICSLFPSKTHALYFYLEGSEQKCFIEELPKDTSVFGKHQAPPDVHPSHALIHDSWFLKVNLRLKSTLISKESGLSILKHKFRFLWR